jgi:Kef-type K+ transport system membrane component KefB
MAIALTGVATPIALSFILMRLAAATPLQAFAAGAALCATSLGTTFTVLGTSGLTSTRLGVVLTSAAMMDDVVGLVMVQVISNLGASGSRISATTVIRPALVGLAFAIVVPLICWLIVKPLTQVFRVKRQKNSSGYLHAILSRKETVYIIDILLLVGLVAGSTYAGTSNLFAAYIAGAAISWWDSELPHENISERPVDFSARDADDGPQSNVGVVETESSSLAHQTHTSGLDVYHACFEQPLEKILKPFFFVR